LQDKQRVNLETLLPELDAAVRNGYAISSFRPGVQSFAVPIMGRDGRAAAAISVSAPESRLTKAKRAEILEQLLRTSAEIGERVGGL
jgi:DNA-binding IclR family transcriptional regulator